VLKFQSLFSISLISILLSACGGGSSSSNTASNLESQNNQSTFTTITGRVVDGEIKDATVFFDINNNTILEENEPSTKSDANGYFTLKIPQKYANNFAIPIVSQGGFDIRANAKYEETLMALREKEKSVIITPISTLIANDVLENLSTQKNLRLNAISSKELLSLLEQAKKSYAELLALQEDIITKDPIELALENENANLLQTNMKVNKVAKEIKKAIKQEIKDKKRAAINSFKALSKALKEAQKEAKNGDEALATAIEDINKSNPELFDSKLLVQVKNSANYILNTFKAEWKEHKKEILSALKEEKSFEALNKDTTPPLITLNGSNPQLVEFNSSYVELGATALDDKDGLVELSITHNINTNKLGTYTVLYQAKDSSGNEANATRSVKVVDTKAPTLTLFGEKNTTLELGASYKEAGFEAIDNVDGNITNKVEVIGTINNALGSYTLIYKVKDSSGNEVNASRVINVIESNFAKKEDIQALAGKWSGQANNFEINVTLNADGTYSYHSILAIGKNHNYYRYSNYEGNWSLKNGNSQIVLELKNNEAPLILTNTYPTIITPAGVELSSNDIDSNYSMKIDQSKNIIEAKYTQKAKEYMARDIADFAVNYFTMVAPKANSEAFWSSANVKPMGYNYGHKLGTWTPEWEYALKRIQEDPSNYTMVISDENWQTLIGARWNYTKDILDPTKVYKWLEYFKGQMQILGKVKGTVLYIIAGDAPANWVSSIRTKYNNDASTIPAKVIESRFPEVLERNPSNSFAGVFQMMDYLRMKYAPNVKLGYTIKTWGIVTKNIYKEPEEGWDKHKDTQIMADTINSFGIQFDLLSFNFHPRSSHTVEEYESAAKYFGAISRKLITRDGSEAKLWIWKVSLWNKEQPKFDFTHINFLVNECNTIGMTLGHGNDLAGKSGFSDDVNNSIFIKSWIDEYYNHKTINSISTHANQGPIYWR